MLSYRRQLHYFFVASKEIKFFKKTKVVKIEEVKFHNF